LTTLEERLAAYRIRIGLSGAVVGFALVGAWSFFGYLTGYYGIPGGTNFFLPSSWAIIIILSIVIIVFVDILDVQSEVLSKLKEAGP
jgi:uncharacterized membrane protein